MKFLYDDTVHADAWSSYIERYFVDAQGTKRSWHFATRNTPTSSEGSNAVFVVAYSPTDDTILLIDEFRIPIWNTVLDCPAGLIDEGESLGSTALRELYEETGYTGSVVKVLPPSYSSVGITDEKVSVVYVTIDKTSPENVNAQPDLQGGEVITSKWVSYNDAVSMALTSTSISGRCQLAILSLKTVLGLSSSEVE